MQRQWTTDMWNRNNRYNSPNKMISRGLNPFIQGSAAMAGSRSPASGGVNLNPFRIIIKAGIRF